MAEEILDTLTVVLKSDDSDLKRSTDKVKEWHKKLLGIMGKPSKFGLDVSGAKTAIDDVTKMYRNMVHEIKGETGNTGILKGVFNAFRDEMELARRAFGVFENRVNSPLTAKLDTKDFEKSVHQALEKWEAAAFKIQQPLSIPPISASAIDSIRSYTDELNRANRAIGRFGRITGGGSVAGIGGSINVVVTEAPHKANENYAAMLRDDLLRSQGHIDRSGPGSIGKAFAIYRNRMVGRRSAIEEVTGALGTGGFSDSDILNMRTIERTVRFAWWVTGIRYAHLASNALRLGGRLVFDPSFIPRTIGRLFNSIASALHPVNLVDTVANVIDKTAALGGWGLKWASRITVPPTYAAMRGTGRLLDKIVSPLTSGMGGSLGGIAGAASFGGPAAAIGGTSGAILGAYTGSASGIAIQAAAAAVNPILGVLLSWLPAAMGTIGGALGAVKGAFAAGIIPAIVGGLGGGLVGKAAWSGIKAIVGMGGERDRAAQGWETQMTKQEYKQYIKDEKEKKVQADAASINTDLMKYKAYQRQIEEVKQRDAKIIADAAVIAQNLPEAIPITYGKKAMRGGATAEHKNMFNDMLRTEWAGGEPVAEQKGEKTTWASAKSQMMQSSVDMIAAARALKEAAAQLVSAATLQKVTMTHDPSQTTTQIPTGELTRKRPYGASHLVDVLLDAADIIEKRDVARLKVNAASRLRRVKKLESAEDFIGPPRPSDYDPKGDDVHRGPGSGGRRGAIGGTGDLAAFGRWIRGLFSRSPSGSAAPETALQSQTGSGLGDFGRKLGAGHWWGESRGGNGGSTVPQEHFSMMKFLVTQELMHRMINAGRESVRQFVEYDELIARNAARVGGGVSPALLNKAASGEHSPNDLAKAFDTLTRSSFSAKQSMDLLSVSERFATANGIQTAEGAHDLSKAFLALDMRSASSSKNLEEMGKLSDLLTKGAGLANTSVTELAEGLSERGAGSIRMMNLDLKDSIAYLLALSEAGFKGGAGSSALSSIYHSIQTSANDNPMGWAKLGVKAFDAKGKMMPLDNILNQFGNRFAGRPDQEVVRALNELGLDSGRGGIKTLLDMSKNITYFKEQLAEAAGETDRVANIVGKSLSFQLKSLLTNLQVVAMTVGEIVAPAFKFLGDGLSIVVKWWNSLDSNIRKGVLTMVSLYAAIVPVVFILGSLGTVAAGAFRLILMPLTTLVSGMASFVWWVGSLAVQLAMIPVNIVWSLASAVSAIGNSIISLLANAIMFIPNLLMALPGLLASLIPFGIGLAAIALLIGGLSGPTFKNSIRGMGDSFEGFGDKAVGVYERLKTDGQSMWDAVTGGAHDFVEKGIGFFSNFQENMGVLLAWAKVNWKDMLTDVISFIGSFATNIMHNFEVALPMIGQMLKYYLLDYWIDAMPSLLGKALGFIKGFAHDAIMIAGDALTGKDPYKMEREASIQSARDAMKLQNNNADEQREVLKKAYAAIKDAKEHPEQQGSAATIRANEKIVEDAQNKIGKADDVFWKYKDVEKMEMKKLQYYLDTGKMLTPDAPGMKSPTDFTGKAGFWGLLKGFEPKGDYKGLMSKLNFNIPKDQALGDNEIIKGGKGSPGMGLMFGGVGAVAPPIPSLKIDKESYKEISLSRFVLEGPGGLANQDPSGQVVRDPILHAKIDEQTIAIKAALAMPVIIGW